MLREGAVSDHQMLLEGRYPGGAEAWACQQCERYELRRRGRVWVVRAGEWRATHRDERETDATPDADRLLKALNL